MLSGLMINPLSSIFIEKVLLHLDIEDVQALFSIFPKKKIQKVWQEDVISREPLYHNLNRLYAFLLFDIKHPNKYIRYYKNKHIKSIVHNTEDPVKQGIETSDTLSLRS